MITTLLIVSLLLIFRPSLSDFITGTGSFVVGAILVFIVIPVVVALLALELGVALLIFDALSG
jgi:hypothetical protein